MVDKTNLDELQQTEIYGFTLLDDEHVLDIKKVSENFKEVEKILGNKADLGGGKGSTFTEAIKSNSDKIAKVLEIELQDYSVEKDGEKSLSNYFKFVWEKIKNIELTDLKVKVTTWSGDTLNMVLDRIKAWIGTMGQLKTSDRESLVGAVNEVHDNNENLKQAEILDRQDINKLKRDISGEDEALKQNNEKFAQLLGVSIDGIRGGVS